MKNGKQPIYPQSENWQNDMEKHINTMGQSSSPSLQGIGLTKREYFAGLAMQGLLANMAITDYLRGNSVMPVPSSIAKESIELADALLAELEAEQEVGNV